MEIASSNTNPTTIEDAPLSSPSLTSPLVNSATMIAPIKALPTEPRPPPTLLPPRSAAVTAASSRPTPGRLMFKLSEMPSSGWIRMTSASRPSGEAPGPAS